MEATPDMLEAVRAIAPGATVIEVAPLEGGSSAIVVKLVLELTTREHRSIVFRQHADRVAKGHDSAVAAKEYWLLKALRDAALEVPTALAVSGDEPVDGSWLAMELVEGSSEVGPDRVNDALATMADFLVRLHRLDLAMVKDTGLKPIEDPVEALPAYLPNDLTGQAIAHRIEAGIKRSTNTECVLHGDFWPGNMLFATEGRCRLAAVIDWEDAVFGDPLVDLATARVELSCLFGSEASQFFTDCYLAASEPLELADLALWELYVSATALSSMHLWGLNAAEEAERRTTTRSFFDVAATSLLAD